MRRELHVPDALPMRAVVRGEGKAVDRAVEVAADHRMAIGAAGQRHDVGGVRVRIHGEGLVGLQLPQFDLAVREAEDNVFPASGPHQARHRRVLNEFVADRLLVGPALADPAREHMRSEGGVALGYFMHPRGSNETDSQVEYAAPMKAKYKHL